MRWFESRNVPLVIQEDRCVFPLSQDSQSIIDCFLQQTDKLNVKIELERGVKTIEKVGDKLQLSFIGDKVLPRIFDKVIVATGGSPQRSGLGWLETLGHKIADPVPSLFTFKMPDEAITELMGVVVDPALVSIQGTKLKSEGPLLITHWGMSGPAILKLSALGARLLSEKHYDFKIQVNWANVRNQELVVTELNGLVAKNPKKILANVRPYALPDRLWGFLLEKSNLSPSKKWGSWAKPD